MAKINQQANDAIMEKLSQVIHPDYFVPFDVILDDMLAYLNSITQDWISVEDELPVDGQVCLVWDRRTPKTVYVQTFMNNPQEGRYWVGGDGYKYYIAHYWQPLPSSPEEGE